MAKRNKALAAKAATATARPAVSCCWLTRVVQAALIAHQPHQGDIPIVSEAQTTLATHHHDEQMRLHSKEISVRGLTVQFGEVTLLSNAFLHMAPGHRYALQGMNGCGKVRRERGAIVAA